MCRFAAYVGAPLRLSSILYEAPHSLERQSYAPREMVSGYVNVDGTGVAWWRGGEAEPLRYVTGRPPWSDPNLPALATRLEGAPILAAVRSQTPGMPGGHAAVHPFVFERWAGAHNGYLQGFEAVRWDLMAAIDAEVLRRLDAMSDAAVLFLVAVTSVRRGASPADALRDAAARAARRCEQEGQAASLNLVLASDDEVVAIRAARGVAANSLYHLSEGGRWPAGRLIASEPLDADPGWTPVPEDALVRITTRDTLVEALGI